MKRMMSTFMAIAFLVGCSSEKSLEHEKNYRRPTNVNMKHLPNEQSDLPNLKPFAYERKNARDLAHLVQTVDGVKSSVVIVSGIYTVVGVQPKKPVKTKAAQEAFRLRIYRAIQGNAHGANAAITINPEQLAQLKQIYRGVKASPRNAHYHNQLGVLIGKIQPLPNQVKRIREKPMQQPGNQPENSKQPSSFISRISAETDKLSI
ncbi:putative lipoprotein [Fictibacillus macauensis ZFHKF-1]|uniref:Putative lipoprotein n=1 Tax=Fictibacillus macauensis ZFHKF-1 TaxID=1196324 RepID=I8ALT7_9BACL|nr:YhcN/YlaJ family sporulation lipoprotein [Fictibacillus macauensis]EIT86892.1 putative lipoprotein [Fictibacillus macauensis ZFHKF-1]